MIIYKFSTLGLYKPDSNGMFSVEKIEAEEKTKIYVANHSRILKDDIGVLKSGYGNEMYLLENKPEIYINAMIENYERSVDILELRLLQAREKLSKWSELAERSAGK